ncbi:TauD/TfdA family dioxygenase [Sneathiella marina]|uniref:TauD/TfdA family dioxygenase n=1 Tax=Sneathiella marina TaxID=2950108 RepID=A0ABY4W456_9PROT|nr:TauD/TfdA family dioxygenase [Sneathiella marina]USG60677.1 TauD/TfdA family dioxygenase [Sneathiella marina]
MNSAPQFAEQTASRLEIPDMGIWPVTARIHGTRLLEGDIVIDWDDGKSSHFLALWLREQCPCTICHSEITRETLIDITDIPVDIYATDCRLDDTGYLLVTWSDQDHASRYHPGWLRANCYDDWARAERGVQLPTWDSQFSVPEFDALDVLQEDETLYDWLVALDTYGLTRLRNVPLERGSVAHLAARIGTIRSSNFGTVFEVVSKPDADSNAYLSVELPLHMDLPTRETPPGLQFLHCIENGADGGESRFADAFHAAKILKEEAPEVYRLVTTVDYCFQNRAMDCDYRARGPLIELDSNGNPLSSRINTFLTAPFTHLPREDVKAALEAKHYLMRLLNEDRMRVQFKMAPGDMVAFDNRRALHARTEFFPNTGHRYLEGCYLDRDELGSRLRMLERAKLGAGQVTR